MRIDDSGSPISCLTLDRLKQAFVNCQPVLNLPCGKKHRVREAISATYHFRPQSRTTVISASPSFLRKWTSIVFESLSAVAAVAISDDERRA
jgi:hypothetical protein